MSAIVTEAAEHLRARLGAGGFDGAALFVFEGEGAILLDRDGVHVGEGPADVTLTATTAVFKAIFDGDLSPTAAFMTGKLSVDGNMGLALKLSSVLG